MLLDFSRRNSPGFTFLASTPPAVPALRMKRSGKSAAILLCRFLFVQLRSRTLRPEDIEALLGMDAPSGSVAVPEEDAPKGERPPLEDDALYEPEWVARFLGIAMGTLYNRVSKDKMPHIKDGRNLRFLGSQLREYLESLTVRPSAPRLLELFRRELAALISDERD